MLTRTAFEKDEVSIIRERQAWAEYAAARFCLGTDRERAMHHLLKARVRSAFDRMRSAAKTLGRALDFGHARLTLLAIEAMERPCDYCGAVGDLRCRV
jgi:hypothetical protein